ncbi:MAG: hypothetical protein RL637_1245 [Pseudomonadota bacterium]
MNECLFCKIINHIIPADIVYEDQEVLAFRDIQPQDPIHLLIIPKQHITTLNELTDNSIAGKLLNTVQKLAAELNIANDGYRTVINCNQHGGQAVYHLHLHLLAGRQLQWPPG